MTPIRPWWVTECLIRRVMRKPRRIQRIKARIQCCGENRLCKYAFHEAIERRKAIGRWK